MKRKKLKFMNIGDQILTRSDMKNIMAGSGGGGSGTCTITCCDCNNSFCQQEVSECSQENVYQVCGPGDAGSSGPCATCVC